MKNALNSKLVQVGLSTLIIGSTLVFLFYLEKFGLTSGELLPPLMMFGTLILGLLFFITDQKSLMMLSFSACAAICTTLKEQMEPYQALHSEDEVIRFAHLKITEGESPTEQLRFMVNDTKASLISLQDIDDQELKAVEEQLSQLGYPHHYAISSPNNEANIALFSIYPITFASPAQFFGNSNIFGKLHLPFQVNESNELYFVSTYIDTDQALNAQQEDLFQQELNYLAGQFHQMEAPMLVFGEYNAVSMNTTMTNFTQSARLIDSRQDISYLPPLRFFSDDATANNHIFYSKGLKCISFETIKNETYGHAMLVGTYEIVGKEDTHAKKTAQEL